MFDLLEEFKSASEIHSGNPLLSRMAAAKWQSDLMAALVQHQQKGQSIEQACHDLELLAEEICLTLDLDGKDHAIKNIVLQSIAPLAADELTRSGQLRGEWVDGYVQTVRHLPETIRIMKTPANATSSLGMTLSYHYAELFAIANDFSFLRQPHEVVKQAHTAIHELAQFNADQMHSGGDKTAVYQNQLNSLRKLFTSVYKAEAAQWKPMLEKQPSLKSLCAEGISMEGVMRRFQEQAEEFNQMLGIETPAAAHQQSR